MVPQKDQSTADAQSTCYDQLATDILAGKTSNCCGSNCCSSEMSGCISPNLYSTAELEGLPSQVVQAALGCGNPATLVELHEGEVVLDLGCGGGIDVLLAARRVGLSGVVYGLDLSEAMLELARRTATESGVRNVTFLHGDVAAIPLPDSSVDVIISNAVISLIDEKAPVLREAFRVLKPSGRFAACDIVIHGGLPAQLPDSADLRRKLSSWVGCTSGAPTDEEYRTTLAAAGFTAIDLEILRRHSIADLGSSRPNWATQLGSHLAARVVSRFASTLIRAIKPTEDASPGARRARESASSAAVANT